MKNKLDTFKALNQIADQFLQLAGPTSDSVPDRVCCAVNLQTANASERQVLLEAIAHSLPHVEEAAKMTDEEVVACLRKGAWRYAHQGPHDHETGACPGCS